jgi:hypothetical protein
MRVQVKDCPPEAPETESPVSNDPAATKLDVFASVSL